MKLTNNTIKVMSILAMHIGCVVGVFGDIPAPKGMPQDVAASDWRFIITVGLFAIAGAIIVVWVGRRISKRSTK